MAVSEVDRAASIELEPIDSIPAVETPPVIRENYPQGAKLFLTVIALSLSIFLVALDSTIVATAIPSITNEFKTIQEIVWYSTAYSLGNTSFKLVWGKAYACFPLKTTFLTSMVIFEVGNVVCATATSSAAVVLGRLISGLGGGGLMCGSFIIMALSAPPTRRPMMMAITSITFGCASVAGPLMGGGLVDALNWRWCFWINLPIGAVAAGIILAFFAQPPLATTLGGSVRQKVAGLDINGGVLCAGSLSCFVLAMHWVGPLSMSSAQVIGSLVGFFGLAALYCLNEYYMGSKALIQAHLLRNTAIARNSIFAFFLAGTFAPLLFILPVQFQTVGNESAGASGIRLIPFVLGISVFTLASNGLLTVWRYYVPLFFIGAILSTAGATLMYTFDERSPGAAWIGSEILSSAGIGISLQIPLLANHAAVGVEDIPAVTSIALFLEGVGSTIFVAASEGALTAGLVDGVKHYLPNVSPSVVVETGATELRSAFASSELTAVLAAYLKGCKDSHLIPVACGSLAVLVSIVSGLPPALVAIRSRLSKAHRR